MSIFDPQGVYIRRNKSTKKGQIIQKRPIDLEGAITKYEIPRSLQVLKGSGYNVFPPGNSVPNGQVFFMPFYYYTNEVDIRFLTVNSLLSQINQSQLLSDFYQYNPQSVRNFVKLCITSIYARFTTFPTEQSDPAIILYSNNVPANAIEIPIHTNNPNDNDHPFITLNGCSGDSLWLSVCRFPSKPNYNLYPPGLVSKIQLQTPVLDNGFISYISLFEKYDQVRSGHLEPDQTFYEFDTNPVSVTCNGYIFIQLIN